MTVEQENLLDVRDLVKHFPIVSGVLSGKKTYLKAVDGVSFSVAKGETFGIVGESGCGKSTLGRVILRLIEPTSGTVRFAGNDIFSLSGPELRVLRNAMQIIFQDPFSSLNPRMSISEIIEEPLKIHFRLSRHERRRKVKDLLETVGLESYHLIKYPHEFSGGQRQRIGIARALALSPKLIICDEPVSALDVSIQGQIINLLKQLQRDYDLTYIFISHDLSVVRYISRRIAVMYLGKIVELCEASQLFDNTQHPYTQALLSAIPVTDPDNKSRRIILTGDMPNAVDLPSGCRFHTRCPYKMDICVQEEPALLDNGKGHFTACHLLTI